MSSTVLKMPSSWVESAIEVVLVGAGGNGSEALDCLAQFDAALIAKGHPYGLNVTVYDEGVVRPPNLVRQRFWPCDLGMNKAISLVNRYNLMLGTKWKAVPESFVPSQDALANVDLLISAVDLISVRADISRVKGRYPIWLDLGNKHQSGQCVIGKLNSSKYPIVTDHYPEILTMENDSSGKSCSTQESLASQDALVNRTVATAGMNLIW
jgi:PRTRC genetic system ThiF family protein